MKVANLLDPAFQEQFQSLLKMPVPAATAFKLRRVAKAIDEHVENFNVLRREAIKRNAKLDESGEIVFEQVDEKREPEAVFASPEARRAFQKEAVDLSMVEVSVPTISVANDLGPSGQMLTGQMVAVLDGVLVE